MLGAIQSHARDVILDGMHDVLKFFGIAALGFGANLDGMASGHGDILLPARFAGVAFDASTRNTPDKGMLRHWCAISLLVRQAALAALAILFGGMADGVHYTSAQMNPGTPETLQSNRDAVAAHLQEKTDGEGFPSRSAWEKAPALHFDRDWRGEHFDPQRGTEVRLLWTPETLFVRFVCRYRSITVFPDARADGRRSELWNRDVAETFLQPDASDPLVYKEFEVSPNGYWIDLAVSHGKIDDLHSGLRRRVAMDEQAKTWTAELAVPIRSLTARFDPHQVWRANFFRIEGPGEPRFYGAWSPTHSEKPNFHVPSAFVNLRFGVAGDEF
jgi:hypothetical protein